MRKADYEKRFILAARTQRWAVTMTKVAIRQSLSRAPFPRWHFVSFTGPGGKESRGVVDLIVIRKSHGAPRDKMKRGDAFHRRSLAPSSGSAVGIVEKRQGCPILFSTVQI